MAAQSISSISAVLPRKPLRRVYETTDDLQAERDVARRLEFVWGVKLEKQSKLNEIDFAIRRGKTISAWVEIKCRANNSDKYDTLMLSAHKWHNGLMIAKLSGLPYILVIRFNDCIKYLQCRPNYRPRVQYEWGGRTLQKRDSQDIEAVVQIPLKLFKTLQERR